MVIEFFGGGGGSGSSGGGGTTSTPVQLDSASSYYPLVLGGVPLGLIFDSSSFVAADYNGPPNVEFVWGSWHGPLPTGTIAEISQYWPWSQSDYGATGITYDLTWVKNNHPDWLLYKAPVQIDANLAWYFNNAGAHPPAIDATNPAVQKWIVDTLWTPKINAGWTSIAIDNNPSINVFGDQNVDGSCAVGHFDLKGNWVPLGYTGHWMDTNWSSAQAKALSAMIDYFHTVCPVNPVLLNNLYNNNLAYHVDGGATDSTLYDGVNRIPQLGGLMSEQVFNDGSGPGSRVTTAAHGVLSNPWLYEMSKTEKVARNKAWFMIGKAPYTVTANMTTTNASQASGTFPRDDLLWCLANFLMCRGRYSYFYWAGSGQYTQKIGQIIQSELSTVQAIGIPVDTYHQNAGFPNVYERNYSWGKVFVNPDPTNTYTPTIPANTYKDLWNTALGAATTISLSPATGAVLIHV